MATYQLADGTVVSGTIAAGDASTPGFLIADDGRFVDLTGASEVAQPERTIAEQLGFSKADLARYKAAGLSADEVATRLQTYLQQTGGSPYDVGFWGQSARDRVMGFQVNPRQEAAEQYALNEAIMRTRAGEPTIAGLPASFVQGAGTFASLVSGLNALAGLPSFFGSTSGLGLPVDATSSLPGDISTAWVPEPSFTSASSAGGWSPLTGQVEGWTTPMSVDWTNPANWAQAAGSVASPLKSAISSMLGGQGASGQSAAGSRGISGADSALQTMRSAITTDEGKYPSPIKPYLSPSMISTGQPVQVPSLFSGFDPKFLAQMEQRGYAIGGEVEPAEYVPGPEGKYFARHAKRGFAVNGPGTGQSDDIPTMLADGEYVIDSDTVAALGDGSSKAGAAVLDKFREQIRKHKRSAPIDDIPPKAKSPLAYIKEAQKGKKNG
jgi:hypothetical protein